jgi:hypothetical protein
MKVAITWSLSSLALFVALTTTPACFTTLRACHEVETTFVARLRNGFNKLFDTAA